MKRITLYIIVLGLFFFGCIHKNKSIDNKLVIFCASSLTDVMSDLVEEYENEFQTDVNFNLASSGTLARQIEHGAEPAIFISANKKWLDYLNQKKLTIPGSEITIAGNSMVLIAPENSPLDSFIFTNGINLAELFEGRLSIGDPNHVPAGSYAIQLLENLGLEKNMASRFLPAKNVRSALMVVELGEAEAGIVYKTDALKSKRVKIITEFPDSLYEPVHYYMTIIEGQKNEKSLSLYNYILSDEVKQVWKKYGFSR